MDILRLNVLLLNEDPNLLKTMADCLIDQGFTVHMVHTKDEALKALEHQTFNVLVTDLTMPENDGISITKLLGDSMPIVMLRGSDDERMVGDLDQFSCCFLDKADISARLAQASWKAYKRFKIDCQLTKDIVAA
ncbi:MAG: response regulator [Bdellovibrionota bacterium]|jgi:CheY-like chemotaxis protein|nr:response regulator [Bdellovibrionota bacterium]